MKRQATLGRKRFYNIPGTEISLLRGSRHIGSKEYSSFSRGNQDIPVCLASYVMERLLPFEKWTYKIIDMVLDVGDQLYKDSYVLFKPTSEKLGLDCVIREIVIKDVLVEIAIGRPVIIQQFSCCRLESALELCFREKDYCMICVGNCYMAIFSKDNSYFVFVPRPLNLKGLADNKKGKSTLLKFNNLSTLAEVVVHNSMCNSNDRFDVFMLILIAIKSIRKMPRSDLQIRVASENSLQSDKE